MAHRDDMLDRATDMVDQDVFLQLLELDEEGETEFLEGIAADWFEDAQKTLKTMDEHLKEKNLDEFSKRAHYLKGSSAQLGMKKLSATCAKLQHYGEQWDDEKDESRKANLSEDEALALIPPMFKRAKKEYKAAEAWLRRYLKPHDDGSGSPSNSDGEAEEPKTPKTDPPDVEPLAKKGDAPSPTKSTGKK
jgi:HPt (histidine-containing phosphotransfer) domain-containing protein